MFNYNIIVMKTEDDAIGVQNSKDFLLELFRPIIADLVTEVLSSLPKP